MHKAKGVVEREKKEMETVEGAKRTSQSGEMVRGDKKRIQTQKRLFFKTNKHCQSQLRLFPYQSLPPFFFCEIQFKSRLRSDLR